MSDWQDDDYEVGYGRPPKHTRFQKGRSGNPKGRPKGAIGVAAGLERELASKIAVRESGREVVMSKAEAFAKRLMAKALAGDNGAMKLLMAQATEMSGTSRAGSADAPIPEQAEPVDYEILRHFFACEAGSKARTDNQENDDDNR